MAEALADVLDAMSARLHDYEEAGDHRAVFQRVYLRMTREMAVRLAGDFFADPVWMEHVLVDFAGYYLDAIAAHDQSRPCAPAWQLALDVAARGDAFVLEDALLGINAHINNDLPIVTAAILERDGVWPDARAMLRRRRDHDRVNQILRELIDAVQVELARHYARLTRVADRILAGRDECLSGMVMAHSRNNVWRQAELLLDCADDEERAGVRAQVESDALALSGYIRRFPAFRLARPAAGVARRLRLL